MQTSLAVTALLMGLVGGPHCVAMCGAACAGIGQAAGPRKKSALLLFQVGRMAGYSLLGGLSAASLQGLGWLTVQSAALRPVWSLFHVAALVLGMVLVVQARQPVWLESGARRVWWCALDVGQSLGAAALWPAVFGAHGSGAGRKCGSGRAGDGFVCAGLRPYHVCGAAGVAAFAGLTRAFE